MLLNRLKIKFTIFYHLLSLVLCEVEDDDVRAVPPLREGEQPPVLVDGERGQVLPPAGGQFNKVRSRCKMNGVYDATSCYNTLLIIYLSRFVPEEHSVTTAAIQDVYG